MMRIDAVYMCSIRFNDLGKYNENCKIVCCIIDLGVFYFVGLQVYVFIMCCGISYN